MIAERMRAHAGLVVIDSTGMRWPNAGVAAEHFECSVEGIRQAIAHEYVFKGRKWRYSTLGDPNNDPYAHGHASRADGARRDDNPFRKGENHQLWDMGWLEAPAPQTRVSVAANAREGT